MRDFRFKIFCLSIFILGLSVYSQDRHKADSLTAIYKADTLSGIAKMELLRHLSYEERAEIILEKGYADELISYASEQKLPDSTKYAYIYRGYRNKGWAFSARGELVNALKSFIQAQRAAKKANYLDGEATAKYTIAGITAKLGDKGKTKVYYQGSISDNEKLGNKVNLIRALANAGDAFLKFGEYDDAYSYLIQARVNLESLLELEDPGLDPENIIRFRSYIDGNLGRYTVVNGDPERGKEMLRIAISDLEQIEDFEAIGEFQAVLGQIALEEGHIQEAKSLGISALKHAEAEKIELLIGQSNALLAEVAEQEGQLQMALEYQKIAKSIQDEIVEMREEAAQVFYEMEQEALTSENEVLLGQQKINRQRTLILLGVIVLLLVALLAVGLYGRYRYIKNTNNIISEEKMRSDGLLLNILPKDTAEELKAQGYVQAKKYNQVTVMFTDFLGFTRYADQLPPEELVKAVDYYFSQFDLIIEKHGLEKIKTVGDAYLCAGGLPDPSVDHAERMIRAAFDIIELVKKAKTDDNDLTRFDVRIGISTGPVVAGVVGSKKFAYDIWGDTVNIASRMETNSEPMCINVSEYTYELIKDKFKFIPRGKLEVKNKGMMQMYFVETPESTQFRKTSKSGERLKV